MEEYRNTVSNLHAIHSMIISKFTSNISKNTSKSTSETTPPPNRGAIGAGSGEYTWERLVRLSSLGVLVSLLSLAMGVLPFGGNPEGNPWLGEYTLERLAGGDRPPFPPYWCRGDTPPRMAPIIGVLSRNLPRKLGELDSRY